MSLKQMLAMGVFGLSAMSAGDDARADPAVGLHGDAPPVCSAGIDPPGRGNGGGGIAIGQLLEFCNAPDGYEVWIDYPADLVGAVLVVDGADLPLTAIGSVRVSHVLGPANVRHRLQLRTDPGRRTATLTVRMLTAPPRVEVAGAP